MRTYLGKQVGLTFRPADVLDHDIVPRYYSGVIESFADVETEKIWRRQHSRKLPQDIQRTARRKLLMLNAAPDLTSLRVPPGNRLESLKGDRSGQHSIRINDQWRICFGWKSGNAMNVEIVDYH